MTATLEDEVADLLRANTELQRRLEQALAERDEALEQRTATAEVLGVINSSPGDLAPVFDAMLEKAMQLCEAAFGMSWAYDGDSFRTLAHHGPPAELATFVQRPLKNPPVGSALRQLVDGESLVHVPDITAQPPLENALGARAALVELGGARTRC